MKQSHQGITLVEILVVLVLLISFFSIGAVTLQRFRSLIELRQAQQILIQELNRARSNARRLSSNQEVSWTASSITVADKTSHFSDHIVMSLSIGAGNSFTYTAPYGRRDRVKNLEFLLQGRFGQTARVKVYGVTGKVLRVND